jgi:predicted GIY-YIG superfamily endonuclease
VQAPHQNFINSKIPPRSGAPRSLGVVGQTNMFYVYILKSDKDQSHYIGITQDLKNRIKQHNQHSSRYTSTKTPYKLIWYCAFLDKKKAYDFEKYLKSSSGYAFSKKRLII